MTKLAEITPMFDPRDSAVLNKVSTAPAGEELNALRREAQAGIVALRERINHLGKDELDLIITGARSHYSWTDRPVTDAQLRAIYEIVKTGPTSMNCSPGRFFFIRDAATKSRLAEFLNPANVPKMQAAPVTVIVAYDTEFWRALPFLFPHEDRRPKFAGKPAYAEETAFRNSTLQGAYFIIAARAIGLDVGPMSGFDNAKVDAAFFAGTTIKSNFLCNIGYADVGALFHKLPRFDFEDVCGLL